MHLGARPSGPTDLRSWMESKKGIRAPAEVIGELKACGIRVSLFIDHDEPEIGIAREMGADRIELYTGPYAQYDGTAHGDALFNGFLQAAKTARQAGLGVNAGHDLNL